MAKARASKTRRGATLREALLVIGVLVIAGVLPWSYHTARERYRQGYCLDSLYRCIGCALLMYAGDYSDYFPNITPFGSNSFEPLGAIQYMAGSGPVWSCPSAAVPLSECSASNYIYYGSGRRSDNDAAASTTIGFDASGNHPGNCWVNALFIDGHGEGARPDGSKGWNRN